MTGNEPLITIREARRISARTDVTIGRWVKSGILPKPIYVNGTRAWRASEFTAAMERLRARPPRSFPSGAEAAGRERGHGLRDEFSELKAAAAEALAVAGTDATAEVLARFTSTGRLTDVPVDHRRDAIRDLRRLAVAR